jgi:hypothetical protein
MGSGGFTSTLSMGPSISVGKIKSFLNLIIFILGQWYYMVLTVE